MAANFMTDGQIQTGTTFAADGTPAPVMTKVSTLFSSGFGATGIYYQGVEDDYSEMALVITDFDDDQKEQLFQSLDEVAILPNPVTDAALPLSQHVDRPGYRFTSESLECLTTWQDLGCLESDTVVDLCTRAHALNGIFDLGLNRL
jgi:hypothetical protein